VRAAPISSAPLGELVTRRVKARTESGDGTRYVFHREGHRLQPALLFHDLRRSAVRNLVDAGVDQRVAIAITGHRTISVFQRCLIVNDDDVRAALEKTQAGSIHREDGNDATRTEPS
jgi:hypothetical protein